MSGESQRLPERIYASVLSGALAWIAYATVECAFSTVVPRIVWPGHAYRFLHHTFTGVLFAMYLAVGSLLGVLMGVALSTASSRTPWFRWPRSPASLGALGTATVVIAFAANLLAESEIDSVALVVLLFSALLLSCIVLGFRSDLWSPRLGVFTNPWTASAILVGVPWILQDLVPSRPTLVRTAAASAFVALSLCLSFLLRGATRRQGVGRSAPGSAGFLRGPCVASAVTALAVLTCSLLLNQLPRPAAGGLPIDAAQKASTRPNVILIVWDTVRADHLSLYGYHRHTTPNLERVARDATLYTRAFASGSMTLSTHASIFTGLYARRHGMHRLDPELPDERTDTRSQLCLFRKSSG